MPESDKDKRLNIIYNNLDNSATDNESIRADIENSDDYYFGRMPGPAANGRSQTIAMEVQNTIVATLASIMDGFTSEQPAAFEPIGDGDDQNAELESFGVQQVIDDNDGYMVTHGAVESCLRYQNGIVKCWVENTERQETQNLPNATEADAAQIVAALEGAGAENVKMQANAGEDTGFTISATSPEQEIRLENVNYGLVRMPKDWNSINLDGIPYFAIEHIWDTRADLIEAGYPKAIVDELPTYSSADDSAGDGQVISKLVAQEQAITPDGVTSELDRIRWWEYYGEFPNTDGTTSLWRIDTADREILDETPISFIPCAAGAAFPQAHRFQGVSLADKLIPVQNSKTEAQRGLEDAISASVLNRTVGYDVNTDDLLEGRVNGHVRLNSPNASLTPLPIQDTTQQSLAYLSYLDQVRAESAGGSIDLQGAESTLLKSQIGAAASQSVLQNQELVAAYISQNIAQTLYRGMYLLVHRVLRTDFTGTLSLRMADQAVQANPSEWPERNRVTLTAGMSPAERNRKSANLNQLLQLLPQLVGAGLPIADPDSIHTLIKDIGLSNGLPYNRYLVDPSSQKGQQAQQQQAQQAQQQQQQQQEMLGIQVQLEQAKIQNDQQSNVIDAQKNVIDWMKAVLDSEVKEADIIARETGAIVTAELNAAQSQSPPDPQANGGAGPA